VNKGRQELTKAAFYHILNILMSINTHVAGTLCFHFQSFSPSHLQPLLHPSAPSNRILERGEEEMRILLVDHQPTGTQWALCHLKLTML
jgi:hypothetical protein